MNLKKNLFAAVLWTVAGVATSVQAQGVEALKPFNATQITNGEMKRLEQTDVDFILSLNTDRLLYFFRERAGIPQPAGTSAYGGWESSDLRGHTLGHYLSALSMLYAQSGNAEVLSRVNRIVSTFGEVQKRTGKGYLSAFGEDMLDRVESDGSGWAPYYTLHKILQGVLDAHVYAGNEEALGVASEFGTYIYGRTTKITDQAAWERVQDIMEVGGFAEAMLNLYKLTGKEEHLKAGQFFQQMSKLLPSAEGKDILHDTRTYNFHHSNSTIPQFIAAEREYELTGDETMLAAARNFWDNVVEHRAYCNGSTSHKEHWNLPPDHLGEELGPLAGESCCTHNLIRLSNDLFRLLRDRKYAEYVERATLNHIMGSIHPETANFMYFHTQLQGSFKSFGRNLDAFWCCTGTGMENHVRYGQSVFFGLKDTLYVTQFFPSQMEWKEKGLKFAQVTNFPLDEQLQLQVTVGKADAVLKIRIPTWSKEFTVKVNDKSVKGKEENGFYCIDRTWKEGDKVDVSFPMHLRLEHLANAPRMHSIFYGPLVLAGDLGTEGVTYDRVNVTDNYFNGAPAYMNPSTPVPVLTGSTDNLDWLQKTYGKVEFMTTATNDGSKLRLIPLYQAVNIRFADYWKFSGDLNPVVINYPQGQVSAKPVTELEDGVVYVFQNANETLANRLFFFDGINLRTRSTGNVDDLKVLANRVEKDGKTYWTFKIQSNQYKNQYIGRTNHANVQATYTVSLWEATYQESAGVEGSGFFLLLKGDAPTGQHEMMMNGDATWLVAWKDNHGGDYTANTSHWKFFKADDLNPEALVEYNAAKLELYKYLVEAGQMYDRGIQSVVESYNQGAVIYTDPNSTIEQLKEAVETIRVAIEASVSEYVEGVPATYGIINPGFENLSNQKNIINNDIKAVPFGWTLSKNGVEGDVNGWSWCSINQDGGTYKEGQHIWGVWNGSNYGNIELIQTLKGVANGRWKLTAKLMNNKTESNNLARIFLNNSSMLAGEKTDYTRLPNEEDYTFSGTWATADNDMQHTFTVEADVTDGTLHLGARSTGFFKVDDFQLTYLGPIDGIEEVRDHTSVISGRVYDLQGRSVNSSIQNLRSGIYITNGKKILKK